MIAWVVMVFQVVAELSSVVDAENVNIWISAFRIARLEQKIIKNIRFS